MNATLESSTVMIGELSQVQNAIQTACDRIPPLWTLKNFVAVNPFLGLTQSHFARAAQLLGKVGRGDILMPAEFYRKQIQNERIQAGDFDLALDLAAQFAFAEGSPPFPFKSLPELNQFLADHHQESCSNRVLTFAEFLDAEHHSGWEAFVVEEISKWCSAYFDQGQSSWRMPWRDSGLFAAWKQASLLDANPEFMGLKNFRKFVASLPDDFKEIIAQGAAELAVPEDLLADFLHRQLMSLPGWSGYLRYLVREKEMAGEQDATLIEFLAIRLVYDLALLREFGNAPALVAARWQQQLAGAANSENEIPSEWLARYVAHLALECSYQRELKAKLRSHSPTAMNAGPKTLQAIFCIDVRSEIFRRALEVQSDEIETIGFAGFFGMAIDYRPFGRLDGQAQCPVLLSPKFKVREGLRHDDFNGEAQRLSRIAFEQTSNGAWNAFKTSAISCFSFVETAGLWFGLKLAKDSLSLAAPEGSYATDERQRLFAPRIEREPSGGHTQHGNVGTGIALADQIELAAGALKNMGLVSNFAKVVLICGHGSATTNNPYGSAYDCGACGGHAGDANARVAAAILNKPEVREALKGQGIAIPAETVFIAALHNTTTDEILIYDGGKLSPQQGAELDKIKHWLNAASQRARRERAESLGLGELADAALDRQVKVRSRDWSQLRPEWGLAGNAAFVAAPRERTKGLNLGGRVFLHNYHPHLDPDKSTLELIMVAPMIVASWINLQYYGSTVNNRHFGSGNKVLHNVVGTFGVWQGNGGDLQSGLPIQSLHDGTRWMHEPLRLSVFIEAPCADIERVIARQSDVRHLIENNWIHLFAIEPGGEKIWRHAGGRFQPDFQ